MKSLEKQLILALSVIILTFSIIFYALPQLIPPVEYRIELQSNYVENGKEVILFYKITNNKNTPMENVTIVNLITTNLKSAKKEEIGTIQGRDSYSGYYQFNSSDLEIKQLGVSSTGKHTLFSTLMYNYQNESKREELTLGFEVI